ncbi:hypothetical protein M0804_009279 [Polistes exclamans]|nr:hypothetical protein M0804_009279 [Polistes exclamans]
MNFIVSRLTCRVVVQSWTRSHQERIPLNSRPNGLGLLDEIDRSSTTSVVLRNKRETLFLAVKRTKHDASYIIEIETFPYYYHRGHRLIQRVLQRDPGLRVRPTTNGRTKPIRGSPTYLYRHVS